MLDLRFGRPLLGDVFGHHQQILRLSVHTADRQSLAVDNARAIAWRFDGIAVQRRAILLLEEIEIARDNGVRRRLPKNLVHGLADQFIARNAEELFSRAVDESETK